MTINQFEALPTSDKAILISHKGEPIEKRETDSYHVQLYKVSNFYVEAYYQKPNNSLVIFKTINFN